MARKQFPCYVLDFRTNEGLEGEFVTFRLGRTWYGRLLQGDQVLITVKGIIAIGKARVELTDFGPVQDMLKCYAVMSHMEKSARDPQNAAIRRFQSLQQLYGPHKLNDTSKVAVIGLRMK